VISAIEKACEHLGGQTRPAEICKVTDQAVHKWVKRGQPPAERCLAIEHATDGQVTRQELRPDVYGEPAKAVA